MGFGEFLKGAAGGILGGITGNPIGALTGIASLGALFSGGNDRGDYGLGSGLDSYIEKYFRDNLNATVGIKIGDQPVVQVPTKAARELMRTVAAGNMNMAAQSGGSPLDQIADIVDIGQGLGKIFGQSQMPQQKPQQDNSAANYIFQKALGQGEALLDEPQEEGPFTKQLIEQISQDPQLQLLQMLGSR